MPPFDYFMVFVTIIIALALEAVARNIDVLIAARRRVRWNWMAPVTALSSILTILGQFWLLWQARAHSPFNGYLLALSPVASMFVLFLAASAALPSEVPEAGLDLKEWYFENCPRYWGLGIALMGCFIVANVIVYVTHTVSGAAALIAIVQCIVIAALCVSLIRTRAAVWHGTVIALLVAVNFANYGALTLR